MKEDYIFRKIQHHGATNKANKVYAELREKFKEGTLDYQIRQLNDQDDGLLEKTKEHSSAEGAAHGNLKAYAATYIRDLGKEPKFEKGCWYGIADVASEDNNILAEIGIVDVNDLLTSFGYSVNSQFFGKRYDRYPTAERFLLLPYSMNDNIPPARAIEFRRK